MSTRKEILAEKHSRTSNELNRYKLLVDSVQDYAIFLLDTEGYIQTWNKGAQNNKGYKPDEIIGRHFSTFYPLKDIEAKKPEKELEIAKKFGRAEDEDWRIRKDGSRFWASVVITALYDNGEHVGFAKVTRDLTERKEQEDRLRKANALLKTQQEELKKLNQSKDDFISLASHQLRTPATAIKQLLGLYIDGLYTDLDSKHMKIIEQAYQSNNRQLDIVNSLLKVALVDAGKVKLRRAVCNLDELIQSVLEDFTESFRIRDQIVEYTRNIQDVTVSVDEQNVRMALENIISNASKYTHPHGTIQINLNGNDSEIAIEVKDSGVGIAKEDLENLFEKFNRLPNELSDEVGGSGLGLYWAEKIIKLHNGRIVVESEPKMGTQFTIILPRK